MFIEAKSVVYDAAAQPDDQRVAFFVSLLRLANGDWLSGFTAGRAKHHHEASIRLARSRDGGETWSLVPWRFNTHEHGIPGSLAGAEMVEIEPNRLLLFSTWFDRSEPDRPLFDPQTEGILRSRQLMAVSSDGGETWSDWKTVATPGLTGCAITGPVLKRRDGSIAFSFESFKEFDDPSPPKHAAWFVASHDGGKTFAPPTLIAHDPTGRLYYWDQRLCTGLADDEFVGMFWTHDRAAQRDLPVHFLRTSSSEIGAMPTGASACEQFDSSRAATPRPTTIPGQIAAPLVWRDGRLFVFVVDRARPGTMRLWTSFDGGATWPEPNSLTVHTHDEQATLSQGAENIDFAQYWEDMAKWSFGHPAIRPYDDLRVLVTFYAGSPGALSVHAARINVSL